MKTSAAKPGPAPTWFPLRRQILDSSVWEESPTVRVLWVTLLLVASEPGRRGTADMTVRSLAGRACLSPEDTRAALDVLLAPDPRSRTKDHDGRRLELIDPTRDWGWRLVNWEVYEKDKNRAGSTVRQRSKRQRNVTECHGTSRNDAEPSKEIEKEKEKEKDIKRGPEPAAPRRGAERTGGDSPGEPPDPGQKPRRQATSPHVRIFEEEGKAAGKAIVIATPDAVQLAKTLTVCETEEKYREVCRRWFALQDPWVVDVGFAGRHIGQRLQALVNGNGHRPRGPSGPGMAGSHDLSPELLARAARDLELYALENDDEP